MTAHLLKENRLKQDDVDNACLTLIERGERISTTNVHKEVGERGSFSTIQKFITDFRTRNPEQLEQVENLPIKADIPESLKTVSDTAFKAVWYQARELAYSELEVQRESLKKAEDDINLKITELQEFSDNQANTIEVLREQLGQVTAKSSELDQLLQTEQATTNSLTKQLNQALHDVELSTIENQTVNQRLTESKTLHEKEVSELKATITQRDAESNRVKIEFDAKTKASEDKIRSLDMQVTKLQTALDVQDKQISEAKAERLQALSAEKVALEKAAALSGQLEQVLKELKQLQGKDKEQATKLATPKKKVAPKQVSGEQPS